MSNDADALQRCYIFRPSWKPVIEAGTVCPDARNGNFSGSDAPGVGQCGLVVGEQLRSGDRDRLGVGGRSLPAVWRIGPGSAGIGDAERARVRGRPELDCDPHGGSLADGGDHACVMA